MKHLPPQLAKALLRRFCHVTFIEEVEGDLDEQFYENLDEKGRLRANLLYWIDVIRAITSGNNKGREISRPGISLRDSLSHFFKIFFRSLRHSRTSATINIAGLVMSLVSFIAIWLYVNDEMSYDQFHPDADNIYRISHSFQRMGDGALETDARFPGLLIELLSEATPAIGEYTRFSKFGYPGSVGYPKTAKLFEEPNVFWVDSTYTKIFSLDIVVGEDADVILKDPAKIIISESNSQKYFGNDDPIGKEVIYSRGGMDFAFVVAGVMKDYPANSHFHPAFMASNRALQPLWKRDGADRVNSFDDPFTYTFVRIAGEKNLADAAAALTPIVKQHTNENVNPVFTKLTDIHFTQRMLVELEGPGDRSYVFIAASVGFLILIVAAINYMNLATARSLRRAKEVGLRKTLGVRRAALVRQFMGESIVIMLISFLVSLAITGTCLPFFNQLTGKDFTYWSLLQGDSLIILGIVVLALGILSGCYPAFYLSRFKPVDVLKGSVATGGTGESFRRVLVVFQFTVTMMLIVCAAIVQNQLSFIQQGKLASHTDQVISIRTGGSVSPLRNILQQNKNIIDLSLSEHLPKQENFGFITHPFIVKSKGEEEIMFDMLKADERFIPMFDLEIVAGRNFSYSNPADTLNCLINEAALKVLQLRPEDAIGQEIGMAYGYEDAKKIPVGKVIGVVKDFPYNSVRQTISPLVLSGYYFGADILNVKLVAGKEQETIAEIEQAWNKLYPGYAFNYWFMDQEFERLYRQERKMAKLSNYFTLFTMVIACLGLFGLASFTAEQKTKEIGIRKVLGASVSQILFLLTNRFVRLVLIACVIAIPLSVYLMTLWLESFAYRTGIEWPVFVFAGSFILVLTYFTVGIESLRAANRNPVESIKHE